MSSAKLLLYQTDSDGAQLLGKVLLQHEVHALYLIKKAYLLIFDGHLGLRSHKTAFTNFTSPSKDISLIFQYLKTSSPYEVPWELLQLLLSCISLQFSAHTLTHLLFLCSFLSLPPA